jgi:hypothetical protein
MNKSLSQNKLKMAQLIVSEWMTLDGVFDADTMQEWFTPFDSIAKKEYIRESIVNADALLVGRTTFDMRRMMRTDQRRR